MKKNLLLICGGGGSEHAVSLKSSTYMKSKIDSEKYNIIDIEISKNFEWLYINNKDSEKVTLDFNGNLLLKNNTKIKIHVVVPCIHGYPGETGDLQSYLQMTGIPFFGSNAEANKICFNKITTKLWLDKLNIATTPFLIVCDKSRDTLEQAKAFYSTHGPLFIKASNQGSSVGCYPVKDMNELSELMTKAFEFSDFVLLEKEISGRELEVSAFEYQDKVHTTAPGEIRCPSHFYSFEEKYNDISHTETDIIAKDITQEQMSQIQSMSQKAFSSLKLRHLARIDFFLTDDGEVLINEINTMPGHTDISMFPKMMESTGVVYKDFLAEHLNSLTK